MLEIPGRSACPKRSARLRCSSRFLRRAIFKASTAAASSTRVPMREEQHQRQSGGGVRTPIVPVFWTDEPSCRRGNYDPINRYLRDIQYRQQGMPARDRFGGMSAPDGSPPAGLPFADICGEGRGLRPCALRSASALEGAGNFHELPSASSRSSSRLTSSHTICPLPGE